MRPPVWARGSTHETAWNAWVNHAGGHIQMLCPRVEFDACRNALLPPIRCMRRKKKNTWDAFGIASSRGSSSRTRTSPSRGRGGGGPRNCSSGTIRALTRPWTRYAPGPLSRDAPPSRTGARRPSPPRRRRSPAAGISRRGQRRRFRRHDSFFIEPSSGARFGRSPGRIPNRTFFPVPFGSFAISLFRRGQTGPTRRRARGRGLPTISRRPCSRAAPPSGRRRIRS